MSDLIINQIGIEICLSCPHDDCQATDLVLCQALQDEVKRVKTEQVKQKEDNTNELLHSISTCINGSGIAMNEIAKRIDIDYTQMQSLVRQGKLKVRREKLNNQKRTRVIVIGVNFDETAIA